MPNLSRLFLMGPGMLLLLLLAAGPSHGQVATSTLSGTITSSAGTVIPNAKISVKNVASGQTAETQTDSAGIYRVTNLAPGNYEVSILADGFSTKVANVTLAADARQTMNQ